MKKLVVIGAGGYAKSVLDSVNRAYYHVQGFIDERLDKTEHLGYPVLAHSLDTLPDREAYCYFIAIGNNEKRKKWYTRLKERRLPLITVVDTSAMVSPQAELGEGCFVGKLAIVNSCAHIGNDCIINTRALIEHGCTVHDHANLSTNTVINGDVEVGCGSFIGSCSVTIGQLRIGNWSTVGAGAVVTHSVGDGVTVAGVPAVEIRKGAMLG